MDNKPSKPLPCDRLFSPSVAENYSPILEAFTKFFERARFVLEIASGSGEHAVHFTRKFPQLVWQPSDISPTAQRSILGWRAHEPDLPISPPLAIDVRQIDWGLSKTFDVLLSINMIHIAPWHATDCLFRHSLPYLTPGAKVLLYGPFFFRQKPPAPSNLLFHKQLQSRNSESGVRIFEDVVTTAECNGFKLSQHITMPRDNTAAVFERCAGIKISL